MTLDEWLRIDVPGKLQNIVVNTKSTSILFKLRPVNAGGKPILINIYCKSERGFR